MKPVRQAVQAAVLLLPVVAMLVVFHELRPSPQRRAAMPQAMIGTWRSLGPDGRHPDDALVLTFLEGGRGAVTWNQAGPPGPVSGAYVGDGEAAMAWQFKEPTTLRLRADPPYGHYGQRVPGPIEDFTLGRDTYVSVDTVLGVLSLTWDRSQGGKAGAPGVSRFRFIKQP
ncbi:MAG: hypothetical protein JO250_01945 [Armatimonadetes bacterium]|nr:hypothetical protein [Armatimonadota bacterium]